MKVFICPHCRKISSCETDYPKIKRKCDTCMERFSYKCSAMVNLEYVKLIEDICVICKS